MEYLPTPILLEFTIWDGLMIVIALFVVSSILSCIKVVKQAESIVIERFGKFDQWPQCHCAGDGSPSPDFLAQQENRH